MGPSDAVNILIIIILLILSAYFSSAETALTTVNKIRMRSLAEENNKADKTRFEVNRRTFQNVECCTDL